MRRAPGIYAANAGAFLSTRLDLSRPSRLPTAPRAADVAQLQLHFTAAMDLFAGDTLTLFLPGFSVGGSEGGVMLTAHVSHATPVASPAVREPYTPNYA